MLVNQILQKYKDIEIDLLLSHVLRKPKEFLYMNPKEKLTPLQYNHVLEYAKRRSKGEPIAYILGDKYFYGLKFKVNKNVLIPRPETEWLVDQAIDRIVKMTAHRRPSSAKATDMSSATGFARAVMLSDKQGYGGQAVNKTSQIHVLDMGTGSGCIAVSIAQRVPLLQEGNPLKLRISASDISTKALAVAKTNAKTHRTNIKFIQSDLFKNIREQFDIITANLPYVPQGMYELLFNNLKHEPKIAVTDGGEVWEVYQKFFSELPRHLKPGGTALLEIDDGAKPALQKMIKKLLPAWKTTLHKDLGGLWRYLVMHR